MGHAAKVRSNLRVRDAEARLGDRQRAEQQRLGFGVTCFRQQQQPNLIQQPGRRIANSGRVGVRCDGQRVRRERFEQRPIAHIVRIADESRIDPRQRGAQRGGCSRRRIVEPASAHLLHQTVDREARRVARAPNQRVRLQFHQRGKAVGLRAGDLTRIAALPRRRHGEQRLGNRLRRQPGEALQQPPRRLAESVEGGLPGDRDALRVLHQARVVPREHLLSLALPFVQVLREAQPALRDVGTGLFERQRKATEFVGELPPQGGVVGQRTPPSVAAREQKIGCVGGREHFERRQRQAAAPVGEAAADNDVAAGESRQQRLGRHRGVFGIDVVDEQQPAGVAAKPTQHGVVLAAFIGLVPLGEIEDAGAAQRGEAALQRLGRLGADEEQCAVGVGVPQRVLERQARLADATDAVDDARDGSGGRGRETTETIGELGDRCVAALEERAQAAERQIGRPSPDAGTREDLVQRRTKDLDGEAVGVGKADFGIALDFRQPRQVRLLPGALRFVAAVACVTRRSILRHGDQQRLAMIERQPRLPLRVGERLRAVFQEGRERWQAAAEVRVALPDQRQRRRLRARRSCRRRGG
ncbi:MAG: hypothetical protein AW07_01208 [Candidatus Accumulibacter sp. SK-11]|nr:MAG: hypothetical protein AW07_01208 [Candidatus Accumulibacter sp. SK-11]